MKNNVLHKIKKPLITFCISLVVFIISIVCIKAVDVSAVSDSQNTSTSTSQTDDNNIGALNKLLDVNDNNGTLELVMLITVLSLAPSILIMMTSFTRIVIVFSLLRNAMGTQQTPPNQVMIGMALFLSLFIMTPTLKQVNKVAYQPYKEGKMTTVEAAQAATVPVKEFMLKQTSKDSMSFFLELSDTKMPEVDPAKNLGLQIVVPAFILSEIKRAFIIGFLLYIPFLVIDIIVASALMSMGMIMLPPSTISLPFKILLFILVDGWQLLMGTLVQGFYR